MRASNGGANRVILTIVGLVLLVGGLLWLLVNLEGSLGLLGSLGLVAPDPAGSVFGELPMTGWRGALVLGLVALIVVAIGLWLCLRQVPSSGSVSGYSWTTDGGGSTQVEANALGHAIAEDALHLAGVSGAKVLLYGAAAAPELLIQITVDDRSQIASVLRSIEKVVLPNAQDAIGTPLHHVGIRVRTGGRAESASQVELPA